MISHNTIYVYIARGRGFESHSGQLSIRNRKTLAQYGCHIHSALPPPGVRRGMIFVTSARQGGGATAKLQEPGWGHIQGGR